MMAERQNENDQGGPSVAAGSYEDNPFEGKPLMEALYHLENLLGTVWISAAKWLNEEQRVILEAYLILEILADDEQGEEFTKGREIAKMIFDRVRDQVHERYPLSDDLSS
jgi:hypothetical protein